MAYIIPKKKRKAEVLVNYFPSINILLTPNRKIYKIKILC